MGTPISFYRTVISLLARLLLGQDSDFPIDLFRSSLIRQFLILFLISVKHKEFIDIFNEIFQFLNFSKNMYSKSACDKKYAYVIA